MNNRTLLYIFLVLLAIYGISQLLGGKKERSFKAELIAIDTSKVTSILIDPKGEEEAYTLKKEGDQWFASRNNITAKAEQAAISGVLSGLSLIKTNRIAANDPAKWSEYEVGDGEGTNIQVFNNKTVLEEFILGRFSFNQQTRSATSFVRLAGEEEVYAIDGFQSMTFGQSFNTYRNKGLLEISPAMKVTALQLTLPDTTYSIQQVSRQWVLNTNTVLDSTQMEQYLSGIQKVTAQHFADDFDEIQSDSLFLAKLNIRGDNIVEPIEITCYKDNRKENPFILYSMQNKEAYFASDSAGIYKKIFVDLPLPLAETTKE